MVIFYSYFSLPEGKRFMFMIYFFSIVNLVNISQVPALCAHYERHGPGMEKCFTRALGQDAGPASHGLMVR